MRCTEQRQKDSRKTAEKQGTAFPVFRKAKRLSLFLHEGKNAAQDGETEHGGAGVDFRSAPMAAMGHGQSRQQSRDRDQSLFQHENLLNKVEITEHALSVGKLAPCISVWMWHKNTSM
jgi:hypothetical protein